MKIKELILSLPIESRKKVLELVEEAHESLMGDENPEITAQYHALKSEIKKHIMSDE